MKAIFVGIFCLVVNDIYADDAKNCISVGVSEKSKTLTNTCNELVNVYWCHTLNKKGYQSGLCGQKEKYFQMNDTLKPGKIKNNQYTLPLNSEIEFGACYGGHFSLKQVGMNGDYYCK